MKLTFIQDNNLSLDEIANALVEFKQENGLYYDDVIEVENNDGDAVYEEISISDLLQELDYNDKYDHNKYGVARF